MLPKILTIKIIPGSDRAGLGLAIAHRVTTLMGGDIQVRTSSNGSVFDLTFPFSWVGGNTAPAPSTCKDTMKTHEDITPRPSSPVEPPGTPSDLRPAALRCTSADSFQCSNVSSALDLASHGSEQVKGNSRRCSLDSTREGSTGSMSLGASLANSMQASTRLTLPPLSGCNFRASSLYSSSIATASSTRDDTSASSLESDDAPPDVVIVGPAVATDSREGFKMEGEPGLTGRSVVVDVSHGATSAQLADSCSVAGMTVIEGQEVRSSVDVCITVPERVITVLRSGWRGRPVVVVGSKEELPLGALPLVVLTPSPAQHGRLMDALRRALVIHPSNMTFSAPLHPDPALLEAMTADFLTVARGSHALQKSRRSLDNSALERRFMLPLMSKMLNGRDGWRPALPAIRSETPSTPEFSDDRASGKEGLHCEDSFRSDEVHQDVMSAFRILVAEDNPINVRVVLRVLKHVLPNTAVDVVQNGLEVLSATSMQRYGLILLDIHMPEMDGIEAARCLRERLQPSEIPTIVALSADQLPSTRQKCATVGIDDFVGKPFKVEDVEKVVQLAMKRYNEVKFSEMIQPLQ